MKPSSVTFAVLAAAVALVAPRFARAAEAAAAEPKPAADVKPEEAKPVAADPAKPADPAPAVKPADPPPAVAAKPAAKVDLASPIGKWKTVDDSSGKAKSYVEIWEENGKFFGKITALLDQPPDDLDPKCTKCEGDQKDVRVTGMTILKDLKKDGDEYSGGRITDPDNGKTYKCYIAVQEGGKKLKVRGYVGFSLLGRTQYWHREL